MDRATIEPAIRSVLTEIHSKLNEAARIAKAAEACASAGSVAEGVTVSMDIEQLIYEVGRLQDAASLLNRLSRQYRRKIQDAMTQLETVVRGMEQFGSRPGTPVEECIKAVQSCQLYVGVFGMRYGSIPDGHDKSMTNIEYDEAQRLGLPSLIYLLNENHSIPAKDVEVGEGAEK